MSKFLKIGIFFLLGCFISALSLVAIGYLIFTTSYRDKVYPGVTIAGQDVNNLSYNFENLGFTFNSPLATVSATGKELGLRPNDELMKKRAFSIGRQSANPYHNFLQIISAWNGKIDLPIEVSIDDKALEKIISPAVVVINKPATDAVYQFVPGAGPDKRGRVSAYQPSKNGIEVDRGKIKEIILAAARRNLSVDTNLPTKVIYPLVSSTTANDLGIQTLLGRGESFFYDSIPGRVYNINLGSGKINGSLIAPNEVFSFSNSIGTVSAIFGFAKAYAIKEGRTVLDDGGGVCQVSTTLYRATLNAGLPVIERHAHSYRVGFYEQGGYLPGTDATVYPPSPDFRFLNDTGGWILVQASFEPEKAKLTFDLFGTSDGRQTNISGPFIVSTSAPPQPIYEDDPTKPAGSVTQVDTAHSGAKVYFKRVVIRNGQTLIDETIYSDYIPWPARYLRGTKT